MSNMFLLSMFLILSAPVAITAYTIPEGVASDAVSSLVKRESLMPASVASYEKSEKMNKDNACIGEPLGGRKPDTFFQPKMPKGGTGDSQCYDASAWTGGMIGINWGGKGGYQFKAVTLFKDDKCKDESNWYVMRPKEWTGDPKAKACLNANNFGGPFKSLKLLNNNVVEKGKLKYKADQNSTTWN